MNISAKTTDRLYLLAYFGAIGVASIAVLWFQFAWWAILGGFLVGALVLSLITRRYHRIILGNEFTVPASDLAHHTKFVGTTSDGKVPSPVDMVKAGKLPVGYLDQFGLDSCYREEIENYKSGVANS